MIHTARISYGKDSLRMLEAIHENRLPLDRIQTTDVWAADGIRAELPDVTEFKARADRWILERYGIEVEHACVMRDGVPETFSRVFHHVPVRRRTDGRRPQGSILGFPALYGPWCKKALKGTGRRDRGETVYIGIAADEPTRFGQPEERVRAPLVEAGITEAECLEWCRQNGMLSPAYQRGRRDGCWFCPFQSTDQLRRLRRGHPDLWRLLLEWDAASPVTFKPRGRTVADYDARFSMEDAGLLKGAFRWARVTGARPAQHTGT